MVGSIVGPNIEKHRRKVRQKTSVVCHSIALDSLQEWVIPVTSKALECYSGEPRKKQAQKSQDGSLVPCPDSCDPVHKFVRPHEGSPNFFEEQRHVFIRIRGMTGFGPLH